MKRLIITLVAMSITFAFGLDHPPGWVAIPHEKLTDMKLILPVSNPSECGKLFGFVRKDTADKSDLEYFASRYGAFKIVEDNTVAAGSNIAYIVDMKLSNGLARLMVLTDLKEGKTFTTMVYCLF